MGTQQKKPEAHDKGKQAGVLDSKKNPEIPKDKIEKPGDKSKDQAAPKKLTQKQHEELLDNIIDKISIISSKYEELVRVLRGESPEDQLEPIVEKLRVTNKEIQDRIEDLKSMRFESDNEILEQISVDNKTIAKIHKERLRLAKGTIPFDEFCRMILKLLDGIGAIPQEESPEKKSERASANKATKSGEKKEPSEKKSPGERKFNESEFQDFDGFAFDKDTESEGGAEGFGFGFESAAKKEKNKGGAWNQEEMDNWGGSSNARKSNREEGVFAREASEEQQIDIGEGAYHKPGDYDSQSKMMMDRMELGQKVNKSFEAFVTSRIEGSPQKPTPRESPADLLTRSAFIKNVIDKSIDEEAEKMKIIRYNAEKEHAKQELERMMEEFKKMKEEFEMMAEDHNMFKAEYDHASAEVERLRQINQQFSEAAENILKKQMMFQEQKSVLESKKRDIESETEQMKMELINLKGYLMRSSYLYKTSNPLTSFVESTIDKTLDKRDETYTKKDDFQFQFQENNMSSSKSNPMVSNEANQKFNAPDIISTEDVVADVLSNTRATLERSRRLREGGNVAAN